ncbi:MAG: hypothetical protein JW994_07575 [Candidatus Omnitrophica bacterium]|nr:hypothetical protein [Candidatus Omnitrophota bacterium]
MEKYTYKQLREKIVRGYYTGEMRELADLVLQEKGERADKWYHKPLWVALITVLATAFVGIILDYVKYKNVPKISIATSRGYEERIETVKGKGEMPKTPLMVVTSKGHHLYIDEPIGHSEPNGGYYEFPIYLKDENGFLRIDQYGFLNRFMGKSVYIKKPTEE